MKWLEKKQDSQETEKISIKEEQNKVEEEKNFLELFRRSIQNCVSFDDYYAVIMQRNLLAEQLEDLKEQYNKLQYQLYNYDLIGLKKQELYNNVESIGR